MPVVLFIKSSLFCSGYRAEWIVGIHSDSQLSCDVTISRLFHQYLSESVIIWANKRDVPSAVTPNILGLHAHVLLISIRFVSLVDVWETASATNLEYSAEQWRLK